MDTKTNLKLYVWYNVFCDYTPGIAFALAHSVEEAVEILKKADEGYTNPTMWTNCWNGNNIGGVAPVEYDAPMGFSMYGGG